MTDPRPVLQDIMQAFNDKLGKWARREIGNAQFALACAEHMADMEGLQGTLCANYDAFADAPSVTAPPSAMPSEIDHPGR